MILYILYIFLGITLFSAIAGMFIYGKINNFKHLPIIVQAYYPFFWMYYKVAFKFSKKRLKTFILLKKYVIDCNNSNPPIPAYLCTSGPYSIRFMDYAFTEYIPLWFFDWKNTPEALQITEFEGYYQSYLELKKLGCSIVWFYDNNSRILYLNLCISKFKK